MGNSKNSIQPLTFGIICFLLLCCSSQKYAGIYPFENGIIELKRDNKYYLDLSGLRGSSEGVWKIKNGYLYLTSRYSEEKVDQPIQKSSKNDTSNFCIISLSSLEGAFLIGSQLIINSDTLYFLRDYQKVKKSNDKFAHLRIWHRNGKVKFAVSDTFKINLKNDSLTLFVNYTNAILDYHFYKNDSFPFKQNLRY
jgi:hypothetical protein